MKTPIRSTLVACMLAALTAASGCKSLEDGAKETFSKEFSCPEDRVTVEERKDVDAYEGTFGPVGDPPAEVKADPERLALWKKQQAEQHAAYNSNVQVFEAHGCDHDVFYSCFHPDAPDGGGSNYADAACTTLSHPPNAKR